MKTLRRAIGDYLSIRRSLGFKLEQTRALLAGVRLLSQKEKNFSNYHSTGIAVCDPPPAPASQRNGPAGSVSFAVLHAIGALMIPDRGAATRFAALPAGAGSPLLIQQRGDPELLQAARRLPIAHGLRAWTYYSLLGLLAVAGLRISEARNLQTEDVDLMKGLLTIRGTKFGKSRLVPIHPSTRKVLSDYASRRDRFLGRRPATFFVSGRGTRLDGAEIRRTFYVLSRQIGLRGPSDSHGPRLHDFRHRFAVETLVQWYRSGQDVERRLPVLSTYLGHVHVADTYWYLTNTPELLGRPGKRLEQRWEGRS